MDRLEELGIFLTYSESIEEECRRRMKGDRGVSEPNKFFKFIRTGVIYEG